MSKPILQIWDEESQKYVPIPAIKGKDGKDGTPGKDGKDGTPGKDGTNGTNGINGKDGAKWFAQSDEPQSGVNNDDLWLEPDGWVRKAIVNPDLIVIWKLTDVCLKGRNGDPGTPGKDAVAGTATATLTVQG